MVGAFLLVMGLSLSGPDQIDAPVAGAASDAGGLAAEMLAAAPEPEPIEMTPPEPPWRDFIVGDGDNLSLIFNRAGFTDTDLYRVARYNDERSLRRIYPGETISFQSDKDGSLLALRHVQSPLLTTVYELQGDAFIASDLTRVPERVARNVSMTIDSSLFIAGSDAGLSDGVIMELAGIFGGVIDFVMDPRTGDAIHVLYEELALDGERYDDGPILAASFTNRGETFEAYRYTDSEGDTSYYNEVGVSMRKAFCWHRWISPASAQTSTQTDCIPFIKPGARIAVPTTPHPRYTCLCGGRRARDRSGLYPAKRQLCVHSTRGAVRNPLPTSASAQGKERGAGETGRRDWHRRFHRRGDGPPPAL